jgi:integrase
VTPQRAQSFYDEFRVGRSVDYHRNTLAEARSFMRWCIKQGWTTVNAFENVEGVGRRKTGKRQLTGDEARKLYAWLMWKVSRRANESEIRDSDAALACLLCLTLALRQKDVRQRLVRDVDLDATLLRISGGKTKASNRPRRVPTYLPHEGMTAFRGEAFLP